MNASQDQDPLEQNPAMTVHGRRIARAGAKLRMTGEPQALNTTLARASRRRVTTGLVGAWMMIAAVGSVPWLSGDSPIRVSTNDDRSVGSELADANRASRNGSPVGARSAEGAGSGPSGSLPPTTTTLVPTSTSATSSSTTTEPVNPVESTWAEPPLSLPHTIPEGPGAGGVPLTTVPPATQPPTTPTIPATLAPAPAPTIGSNTTLAPSPPTTLEECPATEVACLQKFYEPDPSPNDPPTFNGSVTAANSPSTGIAINLNITDPDSPVEEGQCGSPAIHIQATDGSVSRSFAANGTEYTEPTAQCGLAVCMLSTVQAPPAPQPGQVAANFTVAVAPGTYRVFAGVSHIDTCSPYFEMTMETFQVTVP